MKRVHMPQGTPNEARFWSHVVKSNDPDACWAWRGGNLKGYGLFHERLEDGTFKTHRAHRYSYQLAHGPIPVGMGVLHSCDNPGCTNPRHLSIGTQLENMIDAARKGRTYRKWLRDTEIEAIKWLSTTGMTQTRIAQMFDVKPSTINNVVRGRRHSHPKEVSTGSEQNKIASPPAKVELATS